MLNKNNVRCDETPHRAHRTTSRRELDVSPLRKFAPLDVFNVSSTFPPHFLLIQLKPKHVFRRGARDARGAVFRDTRIT